jgi:hypothetical protein
MKRKGNSRILFTGVCFFLITFQTALPQELETLLQNHYKITSADHWPEVTTIHEWGHLQIVGVPETQDIELILQRPGMFYKKISGIGSCDYLLVYDGTSVWHRHCFGGTPVIENLEVGKADWLTCHLRAGVEDPLYRWKKKGSRLDYLGQEEYEGTKVAVFLLTTMEEIQVKYYLEEATGITLLESMQIIIDGQKHELQWEYSDYKYLNGILFPFAIHALSDGKSISYTEIDEIRLNEQSEPEKFNKATYLIK